MGCRATSGLQKHIPKAVVVSVPVCLCSCSASSCHEWEYVSSRQVPAVGRLSTAATVWKLNLSVANSRPKTNPVVTKRVASFSTIHYLYHEWKCHDIFVMSLRGGEAQARDMCTLTTSAL
jgi:uncharacterized membrane protein YraQ (UPF0718 family)